MRSRSRQQGRSLNILLAALAAFAIGAGFYSYKSGQTNSSSANNLQKATTLHTSPRVLPEFSLTDHLNNTFSNKDLIGSWSLVFFGFTNCPDICPLTLNVIEQSITKLHNFDDIPKTIFISVDPKRDQTEKLKGYVEHFNNDVIGLTGDKEQIDTITQSLGAIYAIANNSEENYLVDHSAHIFVIAPNGKMIGLFSTPHDANVIAADFITLHKLYENQKS